MYISHVSHHLSFCETIKCFAGYQFGHYLPSSTIIEIPKESADCLRTMELQSSKIYCQTSFTYPDFPTARMTIWGRKARQQNKYSAKISMQYLHYDKAGTTIPITKAPHLMPRMSSMTLSPMASCITCVKNKNGQQKAAGSKCSCRANMSRSTSAVCSGTTFHRHHCCRKTLLTLQLQGLLFEQQRH